MGGRRWWLSGVLIGLLAVGVVVGGFLAGGPDVVGGIVFGGVALAAAAAILHRRSVEATKANPSLGTSTGSDHSSAIQ